MPDILCPNCETLRPVDHSASPFVCDNCGFSFSVSIDGKKSGSSEPAKRTSSETGSLSRSRTIDESAGPAARSIEEITLRTIGRFELKAVLGRGGFGVVYRAYDSHLERFVALKIPTLGPNQKTKITRFLSEAKAAARLKHANIVSTFESGQVDNKYFIASEFIDGSLLSVLIKKKRPIIRESVLMVQKLAEALGYAHSQGIVHRDVKPHNVIIDTNGEPQLMDFGLAKRLDDSSNVTTDGTLLGTPAYMSPEQARGEIALVGPAIRSKRKRADRIAHIPSLRTLPSSCDPSHELSALAWCSILFFAAAFAIVSTRFQRPLLASENMHRSKSTRRHPKKREIRVCRSGHPLTICAGHSVSDVRVTSIRWF